MQGIYNTKQHYVRVNKYIGMHIHNHYYILRNNKNMYIYM